MAITNYILPVIFTILIFSIIALGDRGQWDCQDNELFIECGGCEGTCKEPVIANCSSTCKPGRCECQSLEGFVRSHDGACIRFEDCGSYVGIEIYGDSNPKMLGREMPTVAIPTILNNQPGPAEDYPQSENNFQQSSNNNNYEDETDTAPAPASAPVPGHSQHQHQQGPGGSAPNHFQPQQQQQPPQPQQSHHPAKIADTDPFDPSINSNQYRRRFRHRFYLL